MNLIEIERYDALRDRLRKWSGELLPQDEAGRAAAHLPERGRRFRFVLRVVIASISALSGLLLFAFFSTIGFPAEELTTALVCIAASEWARHRFGWRHTGAEEGWMLAGTWLLVFALPEATSYGDEILLLLGAASFAAGIRVRAPLFAGIGTLFVTVWLGETLTSELLIVGLTLGAGIATTLARRRLFRSPLMETSLVWTQLAFVASAVVYSLDQPLHFTAVILLGAAVIIAMGIVLRDLISLWTAIPLLIAAVYEIGRLLPLPLEWRYLIGGLVLIGLTGLAERALDKPVRGWTSRRFDSGEELLELAATVAITPARAPAQSPGEGGDFGGGGATERF